MQKQCDIDIIIYGATGYTGRLVTEYFHTHYSEHRSIKWGIAGRDSQKLASLKDQLKLPPEVTAITVDSDDLDAVTNMVQQAKVVLTTVGPYQLYGENLIAACALEGTDYVDLCGEPIWMHQIIKKYNNFAKLSGARLLFSCGFDSIPFDYGVWNIQQQAIKRFGLPANTISARIRRLEGVFSGGSISSFQATQSTVIQEKKLTSLLDNPFALADGFAGPVQPKLNEVRFDNMLQSWLAPFLLAPINTKNIHRTNKLLNHSYGTDFIYDEMIIVGPGFDNERRAKRMSENDLLSRSYQIPGEGPTQNERKNGAYDVLFIGNTPKNQTISISVKDDVDPGYGSSCKMISETAICLLKHPRHATGGIWTPASALGEVLFERLKNYAGLKFIEE